MKAVIYKYFIPHGPSTHEMLGDAEIIDVGETNGDFVVWALGDPTAPTETRRFMGIFTGEHFQPPANEGWGYQGSVVNSKNGLVLHIFEVFDAEENDGGEVA